jgi:ATP-dependent exoDNAse (exonuclease V) alpha subunit
MDQVSLCGTDILPFAAELDEDHPLKTNGKIFFRRQLPLELAHASTVHKYQGLTAQYDVVVDPCRNPFAMGLEYVAISRTKSLQKLHLIAPLQEKHFASKRFSKTLQMIHDEYKRLSSLCAEVTANDCNF